MKSVLQAIGTVARDVFHYESLRTGQAEAIESVLSGRDTLVVMPTGAGKSAIYQIPALLLGGPTVVVSPLIALQKDQSESLKRRQAGGAEVVNSLISTTAQEDAITAAQNGSAEFLFLSPEQLANAERLDAVKAAKPSLFVVDEAHCISEWGHSFRPDYLQLGKAIKHLGHPTVLALTATANPDVRATIITKLGMREPTIYVHGFDRPNIWLGVEVAASETKKRALLLERVRRTAGPGIIYASTRRHAVDISDELNSLGFKATFYHGGLGKLDREEKQEQFMSGAQNIIVATSAFGMGVDKADVRFVFHYDVADSLDSYYQEIGRAGRDGKPASAVLLFCAKDLTLHKFFKGAGSISIDEIRNLTQVLASLPTVLIKDLVNTTGLSKTKLVRALQRLEDLGAVRFLDRRTVTIVENAGKLWQRVEAVVSSQSGLHEAELLRIEHIRTYAEGLACRRAHLLAYFGEQPGLHCDNCDNCNGAGTARAQLIAEARCAESTVTPGLQSV